MNSTLGQTGASDRDLVSVIIPSTGRPQLASALSSVVRQTYPRRAMQIVVVLDLDERDLARVEAAVDLTGVDRVLTTGGVGNAATARDIGTSCATGYWTAYLDDDDVWAPDKLDLQVRAARAHVRPDNVIVSSRVLLSFGDQRAEITAPQRLCSDSEDVAAYLFENRRAAPNRNSLPTSTLLVATNVAREVGWSRGLRRHQDWDWIVRATKEHGCSVLQLPAPLVTYAVGSPGSISASSDWASSLQWYKDVSSGWAAQTRADFLAGQPLRYALQARDWRGSFEVAGALVRTRRLPHARTALLGLSGMLSRSAAQSVLKFLAFRRRTQRDVT